MQTGRYDFDKHHDTYKKIGLPDAFAHGSTPLVALLFFGDLTIARTGNAKLIDAHKRMLERVQQGTASVDGCARVCAAHTSTRPRLAE